MSKVIEEIRAAARQLLEDGKVDVVIGFEKGTLPLKATPCFIRSPQEVEKLIWDETCDNNLANYVRQIKGKKAIVAKGCDTRALVVLMQENQVAREDLYILGVSCNGVINRKKIEAETGEILSAELAEGKISVQGMNGSKEFAFADVKDDTCQSCRYPNPVLEDAHFGDKVETGNQEVPFADVVAMEEKSLLERRAYFQEEMAKCIRCYACRNACPMCYCNECFVDCNSPKWLTGGVDPAENMMFQVGRSLHLAGRCVDCGACVRACPQGVDIRALSRKVTKDCLTMYRHEAGVTLEDPPALNQFSTEDPQGFLVKE